MTAPGSPQFPQVVPFTGSVGSGRRPLAASRSDPEASLAGDPSIHRPASEEELLEGYGVCGRCAGTGRVIGGTTSHANVNGPGAVWIDCPRCNGTGRKGGTR